MEVRGANQMARRLSRALYHAGVGAAVEAGFLLFGPTVFSWLSGADEFVPIQPEQWILAGIVAFGWGAAVFLVAALRARKLD